MAPSNAQKKALAKAKRGIVASGAMSAKGGFDPAQMHKSREMACPHCERIFKQQDRLKQHIARQHADAVAEKSESESSAVKSKSGASSAKARLIIEERERAKEAAARERREGDPNAKNASTPFTRMSCKFPSTILREFVQKQKEFKSPVFKAKEEKTAAGETAAGERGGWTCKLILRDKHKPDKDKIFYWKEKCATKAEAEHRVAVVALAKIAHSLPLQRLLPTEYKDIFTRCEEMEQKRIEDAKRRAKWEEERVERMKRSAKRESAQVLTMSEEKRSLIDAILRERFAPSSSDDESEDNGDDDGDRADDASANELCAKLEGLGFERDDALAASKAMKSTEASAVDAAVGWLCVRVPEDRLPATYAPKSLNEGGVVLLSKGTSAVTDDSRPSDPNVEWLWERGYDRASCEDAWRARPNRVDALSLLFGKVLSGISREHASWPRGDPEATDEDWEDEIMAIDAICGEDRVSRVDGGISVRVDTESGETGFLEVYRPKGKGYPSVEPPVIAFHARGERRDAFTRATRELALHAIDGTGTPCVYTFVEAAPGLVTKSTSTSTSTRGTDDVVDVGASVNAKIPKPRAAAAAAAAEVSKIVPTRAVKSKEKSARRERRPGLSPSEIESENKRLLAAWNDYLNSIKMGVGEKYAMMNVRSNLPASGSREEVTRAVDSSSVVVLSGETGCGKSTQVPQFILESEIAAGRGGATNIIVTQPRRISAIGLAERVAAERCEKCGDVVGYSVRLESKQSSKTRLLFCTTGVLLRRLLSDPILANTTHVVLDEVHERSVDSDLLLLLLRRVVAKNPKLRIVLMSATADADLFDDYFKNPSKIAAVAGVSTTQVHIAGFTHPVREYFLEDVFEMTGHAVGKSGPYAKRKQIKKVKSNAQVESLLAEKAAKRKAERVALGLEGEDEDANDGSDDEDEDDEDDERDVPDDWDLVDDDSTYEVKRATETSLETDANASPTASAKQIEEKRLRTSLLAEASRALAGYSTQTQRSIQNVDESIINYDAIEQLISAIIRTEIEEGPSALVPPPVAGKKPKDVPLGAILVFMPGQFEITRLIRKLEHSSLLEESEVGTLRILPLYGSLSSKDQRRIFERAPEGVRKIVVATNIAETSVTIDDVRYVIDTGRAKEMQYDSLRGLSVLADTWVSQAAAKQRRGRSGRTAPGARFAMFSRSQFARMSPQQPPEMLRTPLQQLCLSIKAMSGEEVSKTLAAALSPPDSSAVAAAVDELRDLRAFDGREELTPLGRHLSQMPVDARIGKMLLFGAILGCLDPILTIAGAMSGRPLFYSPKDNRDAADRAKKSLSATSRSDHLTMVAAYRGWVQAKSKGKSSERRYCDEYFLSQQALEAVQSSRLDYASILADLGFLHRDYLNRMRRDGLGGGRADSNADVTRVIKAALVAGFYPHVVRVKHPQTKYTQTTSGAVAKIADGRELKYYSKDLGRVFLHPTSVNFHCGKYESRWIVYSERVETAKVFIRDNTMVGAYALLLFGGDINVDHEKGLVRVDDWATFQAPARIGVLVKELRARVDELLAERINHPSADLTSTPVVRALLELLASEGH